eukprot:ctg_5184.g571
MVTVLPVGPMGYEQVDEVAGGFAADNPDDRNADSGSRNDVSDLNIAR